MFVSLIAKQIVRSQSKDTMMLTQTHRVSARKDLERTGRGILFTEVVEWKNCKQ